MEATLGITIPVFALILCAFLSGKTSLFSEGSDKALNTYVYYFALPVFLFLAVAQSPIHSILNTNFILANTLAAILCFATSVILMKLVFNAKTSDLSIQGMVASYGTTGYMGVPILLLAFGSKSMLPASLGTLVHNIPIITCVIIMSEFTKLGQHSFGQALFKTVKTILSNPMVLAVIFGAIFSVAHIPLGKSVLAFGGLLANTAGPCALFALGLGLAKGGMTKKEHNVKAGEVVTLSLMKLLLQPLAVFLLIHWFFPMDHMWTVASVVMSALPAGVTSYVFAQKFQSYISGCAKVIVLSMLLSVITLSVALELLGIS